MLTLIPPVLSGCALSRPAGRLIKSSGETMGTHWSLKAFADPSISDADCTSRLEQVFEDACNIFSTWRPDSFISRLNQSTRGEAWALPAPFRHVWQTACDIADQSRGAFNPCLGALTRARGFGPPGHAHNSAQHVAWAGAPFPASDANITHPGNIDIDLSAIAKGYAVDQCANALEEIGLSSFLMEIGGEYVARGIKQDGQPWWIEIHSGDPSAAPVRLALLNEAVATSGHLYKRSVHHAHIASTNGPPPFLSATVVAKSCMLADGWATALYASGDTALSLAKHQHLKAIFTTGSGPPQISPALAPYGL